MTSSVHGYRGELPPKQFNMARYCLKAAGAPPEKPALVAVHGHAEKDAGTWTYRALEQAVLRTAYALRSTYKLKPGSRVAIRLRNRTPYAFAFFGAVAGGLVPVPLSPELTARELNFALADSEAAAIVLDESLPHGDFEPGLSVIPEIALIVAADSGPPADYAETDAEDPAFLIYTSGTAAQPKGVLHAHRSAWGRRPMYRGWYGIRPGDRLMHAGSFNWTYTLGAGLADPWANGATAIVYTGEKDPALWPHLMRDHHVSMFAAVPGVYRQILKYGGVSRGSLPLLRHGLTAGETLTSAVAAEWHERTGTVLLEALGQSELSTYISSSPSTPPKPGKVGRAQPGRCVAILGYEAGEEPLPAGAEGLIAVHRSDPGLMLGYLNRPQEELEVYRGPWFIGGDAGILDGDGYIAHLGRHNDLMNAGGFRVSPAEVEHELSKHPGVAEVAAAEVSIRDGVSIVAAFVVPKESAGGGLAQSLSAFASTVLAAYKCPKEYVLVPALPKTPNGKVKRRELKKAWPWA